MVSVSVLSFVPLQSILYLAAIFKKNNNKTLPHHLSAPNASFISHHP